MEGGFDGLDQCALSAEPSGSDISDCLVIFWKLIGLDTKVFQGGEEVDEAGSLSLVDLLRSKVVLECKSRHKH